MKLEQLANKSILVLGLGLEGCSALRFLRREFPTARLAAADQRDLAQLSDAAGELLADDAGIHRHLGPDYLSALDQYDVIVKSPGVPVVLPEYQRAARSGRVITSPTALFFANFSGTIVGITGTKGKSTTSSLIAGILRRQLPDVHLLGNIGAPALDSLPELRERRQATVVFELSSHQLEGLRQSPHIAVLLNIVPEHLDYYADFAEYATAKQNITRFQGPGDWLVYDADHEITQQFAEASAAGRVPCSRLRAVRGGVYPNGEWMVADSAAGPPERIVRLAEIPLLGAFNHINVAAALAVGRLLGVPAPLMAQAVREFEPLPHRLEKVGEFNGITYFNDSISTVPEATIGALETLGVAVQTVLLGGAERNLPFDVLAQGLLRSGVENLILFPPTGRRIWQAVLDHDAAAAGMHAFFVNSMEEAVRVARERTARGRICLLSPAAPSFGLFRDFRERGERFRELVRRED